MLNPAVITNSLQAPKPFLFIESGYLGVRAWLKRLIPSESLPNPPRPLGRYRGAVLRPMASIAKSRVFLRTIAAGTKVQGENSQNSVLSFYLHRM